MGGLILRALASLATLACCGCALASCAEAPQGGRRDAGDVDADGPPVRCSVDGDCDDGAFCNGVERCAPDEPNAADDGCSPGPAPCQPGACAEHLHACFPSSCGQPDADGDGHARVECGGDDCDDSDADRFPGNTEVCDEDGHDEDCDPTTFGFRDVDGDGVGSAACCNSPDGGETLCGADCDDGDPTVHPGSPETCNGVDDDCDGHVDEGVLPTWVVDADGDGYGDADPGAATQMACVRPNGYARQAVDCDDTDAAVHPGAVERCDDESVDEDCDGVANPVELCTCADGESIPCMAQGVCALGSQLCIASVWSPCSIQATPETCDGTDEDCDGAIDEGLVRRCFDDPDEDGFAGAGATELAVCALPCPGGTTERVPAGDEVDCAPNNPLVYPGQTEHFVDPVCGVLCTTPRGALGCLSAGGLCTGTTNWDYDCDGSSSAPPPASLCGAMCGACGAGGFVYDDVARCGEAVVLRSCACDASGCAASHEEALLPCR